MRLLPSPDSFSIQPTKAELSHPLFDELVAIMLREDVMRNGISLLESHRGKGLDGVIDAFKMVILRHAFNDVKINCLGHWA